jgi:hypothetical protein
MTHVSSLFAKQLYRATAVLLPLGTTTRQLLSTKGSYRHFETHTKALSTNELQLAAAC